jgi:TATA-binding protein-associated factor
MQTDQILDLFNLGEGAGVEIDGSKNEDMGMDVVDVDGEVRDKNKPGVLDGLGELWDERQYEEEYDLGGFLASLRS